MPRNEFRTIDLPIADELAQRSGIRPRVRPQECAGYEIGGITPKLVFSPRTLAEASKTVSMLSREGAAVIIRGAGTKQTRPPLPTDAEVVLDSTRCRGIIDYVPADLTVRVAAGTSFSELQETLRAHRQFFPIDPPFASKATIGGILSARTSGALRQNYGGVRDNVLGMRVCLSDGTVAFTGSKVVKSVAGYDIAKLFVGAQGTLGFIGEVILKVAPLPQDQRAMVAIFAQLSDACEAAREIASAGLFPMASVIMDARSARRVRALEPLDRNVWTLIIRIGSSPTGLRAMTDQTNKIVARHKASKTDVLEHDRTLFAWTDVAELAGGAQYAAQFASAKLTCLPEQVPEASSHVRKTLEEPEITIHPHSGSMFAQVQPREGVAFEKSLNALYHQCAEQGWIFEWLRVPPPLGATLRQPIPSDTPLLLMRRLKAALDPTGTFDPGRYVGGI